MIFDILFTDKKCFLRLIRPTWNYGAPKYKSGTKKIEIFSILGISTMVLKYLRKRAEKWLFGL